MFTAADLLALPEAERAAFLDSLTNDEAEALTYQWEFWARLNQLTPPEPWTYWLLLAGRGFGKTRTGAEQVRKWVGERNRYVNLIGATTDDARDIMIQGESGILAICPKDERPRYVKNDRKLYWPNGAESLIFTAEEPERLRGKQHEKLWADELGSWRYAESWDQAMFGLRLGDNPQAIVTTTPRPTKIIRELKVDPTCILTTGTTYDNSGNLAGTFYSKIITKYEGTRLGRQELNAELLEDVPGALWLRTVLDETRLKNPDQVPDLVRVVVAIDPPVSSGEKADECGIIVAGRSRDGHFYVLSDATSQGDTPSQWAKRAVRAYRTHHADRIIAEVNNGGELVETIMRQVDPSIPYRAVHASRGKVTRAEPVSVLYEQRRVHHVGTFAKLEDQMCAFTNDFDPDEAGYSPDRLDALVWAITHLMNAAAAGPRVL